MAYTFKTYQESPDLQKKKQLMEQYSADYNWRNDQDTVAAEAEYQAAKQNKPTYENKYGSYVESAFNKLNNRDPFKYDVAGDALFQQYKDQYILQGQQAMMDTMGQAAALTGGYGNSYAQSVGQQAYQGYLQQLNDRIPELYQLAMQKYQMEGDALKDQYSLARDMSDTEYGQYRDALGDYRNAVNDAYVRFQDARDWGAGQYSENRAWAADQYGNAYSREYGAFLDQGNNEFAAYQQGVSEDQWNKEYNEQVRMNEEQKRMNNEQLKQIAIENARAEKQAANDLALQYAKLAQDKEQFYASQAAGDGGSGSGGSEGEGKDTNGTMLDKAVNLYKNRKTASFEKYLTDLKEQGYNIDGILDYIDRNFFKTDPETGERYSILHPAHQEGVDRDILGYLMK